MSALMQRRILAFFIAVGVAAVSFYLFRVLMDPGGVKVLRPKNARPAASSPGEGEAGDKGGQKVPSKFGENLDPTRGPAPQPGTAPPGK